MDGREIKPVFQQLLPLASLSNHSKMKSFLELGISAQLPPIGTTSHSKYWTFDNKQNFHSISVWFSNGLWNIPAKFQIFGCEHRNMAYLGDPWIYLHPHRGTGRNHIHTPHTRIWAVPGKPVWFLHELFIFSTKFWLQPNFKKHQTAPLSFVIVQHSLWKLIQLKAIKKSD